MSDTCLAAGWGPHHDQVDRIIVLVNLMQLHNVVVPPEMEHDLRTSLQNVLKGAPELRLLIDLMA